MSSTRTRRLNDLTDEILETAVIADFEGRMGEKPALLGLLIDGQLTQVAFDPILEPAATAKGIETVHITTYLDDLVDRCIGENRAIIGYSIREIEVLSEILPHREEEIKSIYLNALATRWMKNRYPEMYLALIERKSKEQFHRIRAVGLKDLICTGLVMYHFPRHLKGVSPAGAILRMRKQLSKKDEYAGVSKGTKRAWTNMLEYNRHDLEGLNHLLIWILSHG